MTTSRSGVALVVVACAGQSAPPKAPPPMEVAVPLTAASAEIALQQTQRAELAPPWSLTASDGSGLELVRVDARAVVEGPLAFTELHLDFHNAEDRRREGTFEITLPTGAAVSRFAMQDEQGRWLEAEVVERMLARRSYEDVLHRRQDPALLEAAVGNQFAARVFPIVAKADKRLVISYVQRVPAGRYVLPLRGLPQIARIDARIEALGADGKRTTRALAEHAWKPDRDFAADVAGAPAIAAAGLVAAELAIDTRGDADPPDALTLLVDTSASRALGFAAYVHRVRELIGALAGRYGAAFPLDVVAFDQDSASIYSGRAGGFDDAAERKLVERGAAGASDLERALAIAGLRRRVVIVGDGVITAGAEGGELIAQAKRDGRIDRLDVVLAGGIRDDKLATQLARGMRRPGAVLDLDAGGQAVAAALGEGVRTDLPIAVAGATWVYPRTVAAAQRGDRVMIYARLAKPADAMDATIGGARHHVALAAGNAALVDHAVAGAQIEELERQLAGAAPDAAPKLKAEIVKRSIAARVVSSQTAMLVLETDDDYAQFKIPRDAPVDILAVGEHGLAYTHREAIHATPTPTPQLARDAQKTDTKQLKPSPGKGKHEELEKRGDMAKARQLDRAEQARVRNGRDDDEPKPADHDGDGIPDRRDQVQDEGGRSGHSTPGVRARESTRDQVVTGQHRVVVRTAPEPARVNIPHVVAKPPAVPVPAPAERQLDVTVADPAPRVEPATRDAVVLRPEPPAQPQEPAWPPPNKPAALTGELAEIERRLAAHDVDGALAAARDWHARAPGDVLALVALGDALEAKHAPATAARVYGSIIDLFPARADLRRFAGERLERLGERARWLAIDTYRRAAADRPDHVTGHRLLAYALLRDGRFADAFTEILAGLDGKYPPQRFAGAQRVLAEDAGMIGAAYVLAEPSRRGEIVAALAKRGLELAQKPSTRFVLYWETDANDVDLHVQDAKGHHAWFSKKQLESGGELYADVTTGYGPECFAIPGTPSAGPYRISVDYYSQGPMGYGMGLVQVQRFDGSGRMSFDDRPFVVMTDHALVDVGTVR